MLDIAYAVTTAPREHVYLLKTVHSLARAGFTEPEIYADSPPNVILGELMNFRNVHFTDSESRIGAWPNWQRALRGLIEQYTAEAYAIFQDDLSCAKGLRNFLEWPDDPDGIGCLSFWSAEPTPRVGWSLIEWPAGKGFYLAADGALALVMPRKAAIGLAEFNWDSKTRVDHAVATYCRQEGLGYWRFSPSLVSHVGDVSAIHGPQRRVRREADFCPDITDLN